MKSKILESWVGERVIVERYDDEEDGVLKEHGSGWVVLAVPDARGGSEDRFIRVGGNNVIRLARPGELRPLEKFRARMRGGRLSPEEAAEK